MTQPTETQLRNMLTEWKAQSDQNYTLSVAMKSTGQTGSGFYGGLATGFQQSVDDLSNLLDHPHTIATPPKKQAMYAISLNDENYSGEYSTRKAAVDDALEEAMQRNADPDSDTGDIFDCYGDTDKITHFFVGKAVTPKLDYEEAAEQVIEGFSEDMYERFAEIAEDYLQNVPDEDKKSLASVIQNWFEQHGYLPGFYGVDDVRKYGVPTEEGKSDD